MKFIDSYKAQLEKYVIEGLNQAKKAKAKQFRLDWSDGPFFCRAFNLAKYFENDTCDYEDALEIENFPLEQIRLFAKENLDALEFFINEDEVSIYEEGDGWDCAFDCGPYIEAGEWVKLMVDDIIIKMKEKYQNHPDYKEIKIEFCGHDGLYPHNIEHNLEDIRELREEREYSVKPEIIKNYFSLFTDKPEESWLKAAKSI